MGNQIPSTHPPTNIPTSKTIQQFFGKAWSKLSPLVQPNTQNSTSELKSKYRAHLDNDVVNYGLGAMFGAFIGDALGSYLEFETKVSSNYANQAMEMPGGGRAFPFLLPGQFTDDSQLASHLLNGLLDYDPTKNIQQQESKLLASIANQYKEWIHSQPFDIGITTRNALSEINKLFKDIDVANISNFDEFFKDNLKPVLQRIAIKNNSSQSNGSLMRITPMAFFIALIIKNSKNQPQTEFSNFKNLIQNEINMTHGNQAIFQSSEAYVHLLVELILRPKDKSIKEIYEKFENIYCPKASEMQNEAKKHVSEWISESRKQQMSAVTSMGWAKIAFTYSLIKFRNIIEKETQNQQFMNAETYKKLMRSVLILGGDTDTNGAIVGGVIGAVVGFKNLPLQYLDKQFDLEMGRIHKSEWLQSRVQYQPRRAFLNAMKLVEKFNFIEKQGVLLNQVNEPQKNAEIKQQTIPEEKREVI